VDGKSPGSKGKLDPRILAAVAAHLSQREVRTILQDPHAFEVHLAGERRCLTVLFTDVQGTTAFFERWTAREAVAFMNEYLEALSSGVHQHGGVVSHFLGGALLAFWGAPTPQPDHAALACHAGAAPIAHHHTVLRRWADRGMPALGICVSADTGDVIVGNLGSSSLIDYTVAGSAVNRAAALVEVPRDFGTAFVIGEQTYQACGGAVVGRLLGRFRQPRAVHTFQAAYDVLGFAGDAAHSDPAWGDLLPRWEEAMHLYLAARRFTDAEAAFRQVLRLRPDDGPARTMVDRCQRYLQVPPPPDWDGVFVPLSVEDRVRQALLRQEMEDARRVQAVLLPHTLPSWPRQLALAARYRAAREMSGDFYDAVPLLAARDATNAAEGSMPETLQIAVGDVAGKGTGAALVSALAQTALRLLSSAADATALGSREPGGLAPTAGPAEVLQRTNRFLHARTGPRGFVACAPALVEPAGPDEPGPHLRLANAAQVPVLLVRDGHEQEIDPPGCRLRLGVVAHSDYQDVRVELRPGDVILFATDGLPEAPAVSVTPRVPPHVAPPTKAGEFFGFERLARTVCHWSTHADTAEAVAEGIWADLSAWCGDESHHDDMTLLVLRVPPS
jgi:serine phosphatase RsbU (regulator of sigma subunit)/class 3 adenylate cyclase